MFCRTSNKFNEEQSKSRKKGRVHLLKIKIVSDNKQNPNTSNIHCNNTHVFKKENTH